uniref:Odorant Binding Protein 23 n=1 Tax=Dendrolimus punctatus TaxID=238572 RepID=A0A2K8GKN7_9NEOP|nr:Odorant Binding Protein 23 [Dendrolimus punctatus]
MSLYRIIFALVASVILVKVSSKSAKQIVKVPPEVAEPILKGMAKCIDETKNTEEVWQRIREVKYNSDEKFKEFLYCASVTNGFFHKSGHAIIEKLLELFPKKAEMKSILENCDHGQGDSAVDICYQFHKCYQDNSPVYLSFD